MCKCQCGCRSCGRSCCSTIFDVLGRTPRVEPEFAQELVEFGDSMRQPFQRAWEAGRCDMVLASVAAKKARDRQARRDSPARMVDERPAGGFRTVAQKLASAVSENMNLWLGLYTGRCSLSPAIAAASAAASGSPLRVRLRPWLCRFCPGLPRTPGDIDDCLHCGVGRWAGMQRGEAPPKPKRRRQ